MVGFEPTQQCVVDRISNRLSHFDSGFYDFLLSPVLTFTDELQRSDEVIITDDREGAERVQHYQDVNLSKQQYS